MVANRWFRTLRRVAAGLALLLLAGGAPAQAPSRPLRVATRIVPPFVVQQGGQLRGFSMDLWRSIATEMGVTSDITTYGSVGELLDAVKTGKADMAVAAISITSEREQQFEFSQPIYESGLEILVRNQDGGGGAYSQVLAFLTSHGLVQLLGLILILVLVPAHIVWLFERRDPEGIVAGKGYVPGIFLACWWSVATLATQADSMPRTVGGRLVAIVTMFSSVVFVAYFTASVTSSLTVQQLQGNIRGPQDLPGKQVATVKDSTAAKYLVELNVQVDTCPDVNAACDALLKGEADAVVYDAPVLLFYAANEGEGRVHLVGSTFRKENYGIAMPADTPYRKRVNRALLILRENGTYQKIADEWFGTG